MAKTNRVPRATWLRTQREQRAARYKCIQAAGGDIPTLRRRGVLTMGMKYDLPDDSPVVPSGTMERYEELGREVAGATDWSQYDRIAEFH